jgi:hypothetical protein
MVLEWSEVKKLEVVLGYRTQPATLNGREYEFAISITDEPKGRLFKVWGSWGGLYFRSTHHALEDARASAQKELSRWHDAAAARPLADMISITRIANGWLIQPGRSACPNNFTHIAATPQEAAGHVEKWAKSQMPIAGRA